MSKSGSRFWLVLSVLILAVVVGSCWKPPPPAQVPVAIGGGVGSLTFTPDTVRARRGDFLTWPNSLDVTVSVELRGAPMRPIRQRIPAGGTGKVQVLPNAELGLYKYNVVLTAGRDTLDVVDPHIDVRPKK